jgi:hypothetical protein
MGDSCYRQREVWGLDRGGFGRQHFGGHLTRAKSLWSAHLDVSDIRETLLNSCSELLLQTEIARRCVSLDFRLRCKRRPNLSANEERPVPNTVLRMK